MRIHRSRRRLTALLLATLAMSAAPASAIMARDYASDIVRHQRELRACAGEHRGSVTLEIRISEWGSLTEGRVVAESSTQMQEVGHCVLRRARSWGFQSSSSGGGGRYVLVATDDAVEVQRERRPPPPER